MLVIVNMGGIVEAMKLPIVTQRLAVVIDSKNGEYNDPFPAVDQTEHRQAISVVIVVEALAPKVYPRVTLASASTLSGFVVRTLRGGEGLPKMFCLVASSLGHLRSKGDTGGLRGSRGGWRGSLGQPF